MKGPIVRYDHAGLDRLKVLSKRGITILKLLDIVEETNCNCPGNCFDDYYNNHGCMVMRWFGRK